MTLLLTSANKKKLGKFSIILFVNFQKIFVWGNLWDFWKLQYTTELKISHISIISFSSFIFQDCLVSFHPYWVSDMRFSLTLLGQFLEDMEAYAEVCILFYNSESFFFNLCLIQFASSVLSVYFEIFFKKR